jgi:hypothetical protein
LFKNKERNMKGKSCGVFQYYVNAKWICVNLME